MSTWQNGSLTCSTRRFRRVMRARAIQRRRLSLGLVLAVGLALAIVLPAQADGPLIPGYTLRDGQHIPAPTGYIQVSAVRGEEQTSGPFANPQDLFRDPATGRLLVADTGNNRIVVLDSTGKYLAEIGGTQAGLKEPKGVFVDVKGDIWVADTGNQRVVAFSPAGELKAEFFKPTSDLLEGMAFTPSKLVVDQRGFIYVAAGSEGNLGVLVIDSTEEFRGFFGRTKIPFNLGRLLVRYLATEAQRQRMLRVKPVPLSNLQLDSQGFIYAVSPILHLDQIQRLNSVGTNVYGDLSKRVGAGRLWDKLLGKEGLSFGENAVNWRWDGRMSMVVPQTMYPVFLDLAVDELGIVSVLDQRTSQVYQYDQSGNLLSIFGGTGLSAGLFSQPVSLVAGEEGRLYVLDAGRGDIQVLRPTELTRMVHQASYEYYNGAYDKAAVLWNEISQRNTNFSLAHSGLGKALMGQQRYLQAMQEYVFAEDQWGYSAAFGEQRHRWLRDHFGLVSLVALGLIGGIVAVANPAFQSQRRLVTWLRNQRQRTGLWAVPVLLMLTILARLVALSTQSFHFRQMRPEEIRIMIEGGKILIPWITWCVAALGIGEIVYGEGTFRKILIASAWALWPLIVIPIPASLLTHAITLDEKNVYTIIQWAMWILLAWNMIGVVRDVHNFELGRATVITAQNLLGMLVVWILVGLVYALSAEIVRFIGQILMEIYVRMY